MPLVWGSAVQPTAAVRGQRMGHKAELWQWGSGEEGWRDIWQETGINRLWCLSWEADYRTACPRGANKGYGKKPMSLVWNLLG